jgi:hypothetical protein
LCVFVRCFTGQPAVKPVDIFLSWFAARFRRTTVSRTRILCRGSDIDTDRHCLVYSSTPTTGRVIIFVTVQLTANGLILSAHRHCATGGAMGVVVLATYWYDVRADRCPAGPASPHPVMSIRSYGDAVAPIAVSLALIAFEVTAIFGCFCCSARPFSV